MDKQQDTDLLKTFSFQAKGMHCHSCELLTESELRAVPYVTAVKASLKNQTLEVSGYFGEMSESEAAKALTEFIEQYGYTLFPLVDSGLRKSKYDWLEFKAALLIALAFVALFVFLQKLGIVNLVNVTKLNYPTIFLIGVVASLSTCMAVVGGLVLSMSASFAVSSPKWRSASQSITLFHLSRLVFFFVLGGLIGVLGSVFALSQTTTLVLNMLIVGVMLLLGINLLDLFHFTKKIQPSMPKFLSKHTIGLSKINHVLTPVLVGALTFFLPCGFTQSMQIYTLSTGSFLAGGLTMLVFALGTLPILALVSFSSFSVRHSSKKGIFFKTAGLIVILFALFNLTNSLAAAGVISPLFGF